MTPEQAKKAIEEAWKAPQIDLSALPDDPVVLKGLLQSVLAEAGALCRKGRLVEERLMLELMRRYGRSSERCEHEGQLFFFDSDQPPEAVPETPSSSQEEPENDKGSSRPRPEKKRNGRRRLPDNLPRDVVVLDLDEEYRGCPGCGQTMGVIGEDVTEQLDYVPASLIVRRFVRPKYACRTCHDGVLTAEPPIGPIIRGLPGAGLLAQVVTAKYADHLPLNRQEAIFKRHGVEIPRSTMCDWVGEAARLAKPVYDLMVKEVLAGRKIHTDDTPVLVLDGKNRGKTQKRRQKDPEAKAAGRGYLWVYVGDRDHPCVVYDYTPSRSRHGPESFLGSYQGYLQADDFAGYEALYRTGRIKEVACWAHARRKFHDAKVTDLSRARTALAMIGELYAIERELGDAPDDERKRQRELRARPVLDRIEAWLLAERRHVLPKTQIAKAINYALNLWPALVRYLEDGALAIDNNTAENGVRPVALGRKNWLFAGSDEGARRAAVLASLVETCKRHAIDAFSYLRDIFQTLPTFRGNLADLMPSAWKARQTPAD